MSTGGRKIVFLVHIQTREGVWVWKIFSFNGSSIAQLAHHSFQLGQKEKLASSKLPEDTSDITSMNHRLQYTSTCFRPDFSSYLQLLDISNEKDVRALLDDAQESAAFGLTFVRLDFESVKVVVFSDASFGNLKDYSSQMGYLIFVVDGDGNAIIIHCTSNKCRRITKIEMAAEPLALASSFDNALFAQHIFSRFTRSAFQSICFAIPRPHSTV